MVHCVSWVRLAKTIVVYDSAIDAIREQLSGKHGSTETFVFAINIRRNLTSHYQDKCSVKLGPHPSDSVIVLP